jgi:hypothetical protein
MQLSKWRLCGKDQKIASLAHADLPNTKRATSGKAVRRCQTETHAIRAQNADFSPNPPTKEKSNG